VVRGLVDLVRADVAAAHVERYFRWTFVVTDYAVYWLLHGLPPVPPAELSLLCYRFALRTRVLRPDVVRCTCCATLTAWVMPGFAYLCV